MSARPSILCPVDFSDASRGALRYAAAVAAHFGATLIVMTVEDPLLTEAMDLGTGVVWKPEDTRAELNDFAKKALGGTPPAAVSVDYEVAVGKPAAEILRLARERAADLLVISTHGLTGMRKLFFGSTTERVLRETTTPVLITPASDHGPARLEEVRELVRRILVPVDLSPASAYQVRVARGLAEATDLPVLVLHVIEPVHSRLAARLHLAHIEAERRAVAEDGLNELVSAVPEALHPEALLAYGDPAEEIAKVARDRRARLIVMGLHGSPLLGPRMGSVTYRVMCLAPTLVLALPPQQSPELQEVKEQAARPAAETQPAS